MKYHTEKISKKTCNNERTHIPEKKNATFKYFWFSVIKGLYPLFSTKLNNLINYSNNLYKYLYIRELPPHQEASEVLTYILSH